ncbi:MAG: type I methionyl aminopeptidase [Myxococcota bacterium]
MLQTERAHGIQLKNQAHLEAMRVAGRISAECLAWVISEVAPGQSTQEIDDLVCQFAERHGVTPAPKGYRGFPRSVCTSINEVICHGIPAPETRLREGDIIGIDVALIVEGFHGDNAATVGVGDIDEPARTLLSATLEAQRRSIAIVAPGTRLGDIGHAIQSHVEAQGFSVVRDFVGHGVGRRFHEEPQVLHYGTPGRGMRLRPGLTFTIEPMINAGAPGIEIQDDGWTALTADRSLSAQYEHTLEVTEDGVRVLTVQNETGAWEPPGRWTPPGYEIPA